MQLSLSLTVFTTVILVDRHCSDALRMWKLSSFLISLLLQFRIPPTYPST